MFKISSMRITPAEIKKSIERYLQKDKNIIELLTGGIIFPLVINLRPLKKKSDFLEYHQEINDFVKSWIDSDCLYQDYFGVKLPYQFTFGSLDHFLSFINRAHPVFNVIKQMKLINAILFNKTSSMFDENDKELLRYLINGVDVDTLLKLIPKLKAGVGENKFIRQLDIGDIDTKFIERNIGVIDLIMRRLYPDYSTLSEWLSFEEKPDCWVLVSNNWIPQLNYYRIDGQTLSKLTINEPILIVENEQTILTLSKLNLPFFICGGTGKNLDWLGDWDNVYYWGDIDSDGLMMLSLAKDKIPSIKSVMMDSMTINTFRSQIVQDTTKLINLPSNLNDDEITLFQEVNRLKERLEQEKISEEYILRMLSKLPLHNNQ
jgi:conserved hypothetical protein